MFSLSCQNKENEIALDAIKQNNEFLTNQIETQKAIVYNACMDYPQRFDTIYLQKLNDEVKNTFQLKNKTAYNAIYKSIDSLTKSQQIDIKLHQTTSENTDVLKNNLLLYLNQLYQAYLNRNVLFGVTSHHKGFKTVYLTDADSVNLYFIKDNPYLITTDSIVNEQHKNLNYKFEKDHLVGKIKYKTGSKKTKYYGKVFYNDDGKVIFLQNFEQEITKQDIPPFLKSEIEKK